MAAHTGQEILLNSIMRDLLDIIDRKLLEDEAKPTFSKNDLLDLLKKMGYEDTSVKGNKIKVLVQVPDKKQNEFRLSVLKDILAKLQQEVPDQNPQYSTDAALQSSIGGIVFGNNNFVILAKDKGKQGEKSSGVANEIELVSLIQSVIEKYGTADITFTDEKGNSLSIDNATGVKASGKDVKNRKKADVEIYSADKRLPVSLKQLDADHWESADSLVGTRAREVIKKLVADGYVRLDQIGTNKGVPVYKLSKEVVMEPTPEEAMKAIFGSDLNPEGGIVIQTFKPEHFKQDKNKINIDAYAVIKGPEDIPESHILVWILRNNKDRNSKSLGIPGIRPLGVTMERGLGKQKTKDVVFVDINGNVIKPSDFSKDAKSIADMEKQKNAEPLGKASKSITEPRLKRDTTPTPEPKGDVGPAGRALR